MGDRADSYVSQSSRPGGKRWRNTEDGDDWSKARQDELYDDYVDSLNSNSRYQRDEAEPRDERRPRPKNTWRGDIEPLEDDNVRLKSEKGAYFFTTSPTIYLAGPLGPRAWKMVGNE